ncbi:MAG: FdhF/YdeP family oxidoreductase [Bacteroidota bacterium]
MVSKRNTSPNTSQELTGIQLKEPANYAAGMLGVKVALDHAIGEMGVAKAMKMLAKMNQKDGFDCPGCAWPDPDDKRLLFAEYCENGAKALAEEATRRRVTPDFFAKYSIEELSTWSDYKIGKSGRITHPMILREGSSHYEAIEWEEAYRIIAAQLHALDNPNEAIFYTSGRSSNEAAYMYGLFARALGTNNMPDCSNMCHESSGAGLGETLGIGKGSVVLDDLHEAEVIMVIGQNPGTNHPRMLSALQTCKLNGGKVITINPLREAGLERFKNPQRVQDYFNGGTAITDVFLQVKINQDIPLLKAIMKKLKQLEVEKGNVFDHEFITQKTQGYETLLEDLDQYNLQELIEQSGVNEEEIDEAIALLAPAKKIIICWAMGLTQHKNGVANIKECVNLLLLKGSIAKRGAGTCPVRGHSNVQGDRSVGIFHKISEASAEAIRKVFNFEPATEEGFDVVASIKAMYEGRVKVFVGLGGNLLMAVSDTNYAAQAFRNCNLTVSISTKLNRTHLVPGKVALILPTLGRSEKDLNGGKERKLSVENSVGKVHLSKGDLEPASPHLRSEPDIILEIADAYFQGDHPVDWLSYRANYGLIREKIGQTKTGFENYNERVNQDSGFYLPNNAREGDFSKLPNGRAQFSINALPDHQLKENEFLLMSIRSHDQYNTTIYGLDDRYRGVYNERRVVFMNEADMNTKGLKKLELINLISEYDGITREAKKFHVVPYDIPSGNLACYFPEGNELIPIDQFADGSRTPISKSVVVRVERYTEV